MTLEAMQIYPEKGFLLVKKYEEENPKKGNLLLLEDKSAPTKKVIVERSHPDSLYESGEILFLLKYSGTEIKHNGETYFIVKEEEILASLRGGDVA